MARNQCKHIGRTVRKGEDPFLALLLVPRPQEYAVCRPSAFIDMHLKNTLDQG